MCASSWPTSCTGAASRRSRRRRASAFDPHVHEALSHQPSEQPEGVIAAVWQRGYRLGDRIVRAARVVVSSGPAPAEGEE